MFGMTGYLNGIILISMISAELQLNEGIFNNIGLIGFTNGSSSSYNNIYVQIQIKDNHGLYIGAIAGRIFTNQWQAQNITVNESYISGNRLLGLFTSSTQTGNIIQCSFSSSYIFADNQDQAFIGGLIGDTENSLVVQQCIVQNISLFSNNTYAWSISAGLIGDTHDHLTMVQQTIVQSSNVQSYGAVQQFVSSAGLIACAYRSITTQDVQVSNMNILASSSTYLSSCAGLVSKICNQTITTTNTKITSIQIYCQGIPFEVGIVFTYGTQTIYNIDNTQTHGTNSINDTPITNCVSVATYSQSGC
ncbi:Hypothetical_protein [Hexamita inflata]|uniref:Hypothetical_protein n=1 Tax=Hexamita inflata TaxID=28002 RepID=A0ABP1JW17_9EUKA